jgi:hypothetical protein
MGRVLAGIIYLLPFLAVPARANNNLLDRLTFRIETSASWYNLNLSGFPHDFLEGIWAGGVDLRHLIVYDAPARQLSIRTFIAPSGLPPPTSLLIVQNNEIEGFRADVTSISIDEPNRTISFQGFIAAGFNSVVHYATAHDEFRLTARYRSGFVTGFDETRIQLAAAVLGSRDGSGTLVVENVPNRPPLAEAGPEFIQSFMKEILLDGSRSRDEDGDELDYKWHVIVGAAALRGCETSTPVLQLIQGQSGYDVRPTVTDSRGASSYDYIRINYVGP